MSDEFEEEPDEGESPPSYLSRKEGEIFNQETRPNTVVIQLWGKGRINFNPPNSVQIFAFIALVLVLLTIIIVSISSIFAGNSQWTDTLMSALGHAVTAVAGAIVGAQVAGKDINN